MIAPGRDYVIEAEAAAADAWPRPVEGLWRERFLFRFFDMA